MDNVWHIGFVSIGLKELNKVSRCAPRSLLNNAAATGVSDHTREAIDKVGENGTGLNLLLLFRDDVHRSFWMYSPTVLDTSPLFD
jgi:hypothetical protein